MELSSSQAAAYCQRVGIEPDVSTDIAGLTKVQDAHLRAIPFENFDILLGRGVSVEPDDVFDQLVTKRRGGYCFTSNMLLDAGLRRLGFDASLHLGRVLFGPPGPTPARLHALVLVNLNDETYLVDAGFGAHTPRGIIPLRDGAELNAIGRTWRILDDPEHRWRLQDQTADGWRDLYLFDDSRTYASDVDVANFWIANCPDSPFVHTALVVCHTPDGRLSLLNRTATHYRDADRRLEAARAARPRRRPSLRHRRSAPGPQRR